MKLIKICIFSCALLSITGCDLTDKIKDATKSEITAEGQMFVVQQNRMNVKLGAVSIHAIPESELLKIIPKHLLSYGKTIELKSEIRKGYRQLESFEEQIASLEKITENTSIENAYTLRNFCQRLRAKHSEVRDSFTQAERAANLIDTFGDKSTALFYAMYSDVKALSIGSTQTDADGHYKLTIKSNEPVYLFARASRNISTTTENYEWVVKLEDSQDNLYLTTSNTLTPLQFGKLEIDSGYDYQEASKAADAIIKRHNLSSIEDIGKLTNQIPGLEAQIENVYHLHEKHLAAKKNLEELSKVIQEIDSELEELDKLGL